MIKTLDEFAEECIKIILETGFLKEVINSMGEMDEITDYHFKRIYNINET